MMVTFDFLFQILTDVLVHLISKIHMFVLDSYILYSRIYVKINKN